MNVKIFNLPKILLFSSLSIKIKFRINNFREKFITKIVKLIVQKLKSNIAKRGTGHLKYDIYFDIDYFNNFRIKNFKIHL